MWWLNYHGMLTIYGGNGWVLLVSGFVNKYIHILMQLENTNYQWMNMSLKREGGEREQQKWGQFFLSTSLRSLKLPIENDPP